MELFGVEYLFEKALLEIKTNADRLKYRAYITDSIKNLTELIIKIGGGKDVDIPRYADMIADKEQQAEEEQRAREEAEQVGQAAMSEFMRQCELIARERKQKEGREQIG